MIKAKVSSFLSLTLIIAGCQREPKFQYFYSPSKSAIVTRCDYTDSTFFYYGKVDSLDSSRPRLSKKYYEFRSGWNCMLTWKGDTAIIITSNEQELPNAFINNLKREKRLLVEEMEARLFLKYLYYDIDVPYKLSKRYIRISSEENGRQD